MSNGYPKEEVIQELLATASRILATRTGTEFRLELDTASQVVKATRVVDGYHCAVAVRSLGKPRYVRREGEAIGGDITDETRRRIALVHRLTDAIEAIENGHRLRPVASQAGAA
ncbi:hypothetical protein [Methylobacterium sp. A52T]